MDTELQSQPGEKQKPAQPRLHTGKLISILRSFPLQQLLITLDNTLQHFFIPFPLPLALGRGQPDLHTWLCSALLSALPEISNNNLT